MRRAYAILPLLALAATPLAAAKPAHKPAAKAASKPAPAKPHATERQAEIDPAIAKAVADPTRSAKNRARDRYRHPAATLSFFGVKPAMTVVEMLPWGGWYSEILAPYLAADGLYVAALEPGKQTDAYKALLAADPDRYGKVQVVDFSPGQPNNLVPPGTADMILTFRNIHNFFGSPDQPGYGNAPQLFADWFRALKPGGVLGIVEHRLPENMDPALQKTTGYVKRSTVIGLAIGAGFRFAGASEVNANPKDDHDHPKGVWTLPPTLQLGDKDRAKYEAIGESDRMTLKFVKPDPDAPASDAGGPAPADPATPPPGG